MTDLPRELLSLKLPHKLRPGTDLISKQILLNPTVIDIVVETTFGSEGICNYSPWPTEWPNRTISDILYLPISQQNGSFPPILVEIQHTVDNDFILRLMSHAISLYRQYNKIPIVLTFVISSMKYEVSKKTVQNKDHPFLRQYSCQPWAKMCYFVTGSSIETSLASPLSPFVALSTFFISQHPSLLVNPFRNDPTIQLLYSIAARVFQEQMDESTKPTEDLLLVCENTENVLTKAISALSEEVPDVEKCKKILDDGKLLPAALKRKYESISLEAPNTNTNTSTSSSTNADTITNANTSTSSNTSNNTNTSTISNWDYLEHYLSKLNNNTPISWERVYEDGRELGFFKNYTKWTTMKSSYYRWKKNKN